MKIIIAIKTVYGNQSIYPVCDNAKLFAEIAGTKTLTKQAIQKIMALGVTVELDKTPSLEEALGMFTGQGALA
jgi:hypothetical protein